MIFKIGDTFVICDAGGGTVDLISYEIKAISPRLELSEIVEGNGKELDSLFIRCDSNNCLDRRYGRFDICKRKVQENA